MTPPVRIPIEGDLVTIPRHEGTFKVIAIRNKGQVADVELVTVPTYIEKDVPWGVLIYIESSRKRSART